MKPRTEIVTASQFDQAPILLPAITWLEAPFMLAVSGVPAEVAAQVLVLQGAPRRVADSVVDRREPPSFYLNVSARRAARVDEYLTRATLARQHRSHLPQTGCSATGAMPAMHAT